ncbi:PspC domain-containing protein [Candidatus Parcubacteria bacterium]|nr:PspC domain-containing protein [Candidatus Parcubacteria bacterium]
MKKLYRSRENKVFAGVIGGIGEYFDIDPVILRIAWVLLVVFTAFAPGIIVYLVSVFIVPKQPK